MVHLVAQFIIEVEVRCSLEKDDNSRWLPIVINTRLYQGVYIHVVKILLLDYTSLFISSQIMK